MRIITGALRGREIRSPRGHARPAMGRTREALFSMLEARGLSWPECPVLDLFAGSGSLAFEALSRGAPSATLVDNSTRICAGIAAMAADLDVAGRCHIICQEAARFLARPHGAQFSLVFIDPPYRRDFINPALDRLKPWLAPGAYVAAEIESGSKIKAPEYLAPEAEKSFGQTLLRIWRNNEDSAIPGHI